jgi:alpha-glucosidase
MTRFLAALFFLAAAGTASAAPPIGHRPDGAEFSMPAETLRVTALTPDILRVRIDRIGTSDRRNEDASWAVPAAVRAHRAAVTPTADGFATASLRVRFVGGLLSVEDKAGKVIVADAPQPVWIAGSAFTLKKRLPLGTRIFGLGDKTGGLDRGGKTFVDWNTDAFGFSPADDPIYKSIPFFIAVGGEGGSYGLFLDNTRRTWFDFGHKEDGVIAFGGPDGPIDYYLIAGPSTAEVVRRYTDVTGKAPLTPLWALGYQQSRYSYMSAEEVRQIAARLRSDRIPADVLWMDIDYQDRNRPFTINTKTFPDMKGLVAGLLRDGFRAITITDLHVAYLPGRGYAPYDSGAAIDAFVHTPDGSVYVAPVWPGPSVFPDFTDAKVRAWWGTLFRRQVEDGIAGAWNDMNEPAIFETPTKTMPLDVVHRIASDDFAPRKADHREIHNVYGMENTRATYDGLRRLAPDERAFVMTRASYAGGQRYAVTWTGDNSATWEHLKLSVQQLINLGLSGFSYSGADVSGFAGGPSADLLTRWFEIGAFYPVFRDHSAVNTPRVEPWVDGPEHLAIRRRFVEERYRLMPYLYALADENARFGDPILRPVFYDHPGALQMGCDQSWTFTLGRDLLIAPPPHPESPAKYDICLPPGGWYDYWTGLAEGTPGGAAKGETIQAVPALDRLPVFVRAGAILPRQPLVQSTAETPKGPLSLDVYPGPDCRGTIYLDDGHSMAFEKGAYLRQTVRCRITGAGLELDFGRREGTYRPWWREIAVTIHGRIAGGQATAGARDIAVRYDSHTRTETLVLPDMAEGHVTVH